MVYIYIYIIYIVHIKWVYSIIIHRSTVLITQALGQYLLHITARAIQNLGAILMYTSYVLFLIYSWSVYTDVIIIVRCNNFIIIIINSTCTHSNV